MLNLFLNTEQGDTVLIHNESVVALCHLSCGNPEECKVKYHYIVQTTNGSQYYLTYQSFVEVSTILGVPIGSFPKPTTGDVYATMQRKN